MSADAEYEKQVSVHWAVMQVAADRALEAARYRQPEDARSAAQNILDELDLLEAVDR